MKNLDYYFDIVNDIENDGLTLNFIIDGYRPDGRHYGYQPYYELSWYDHCNEGVQYAILPREVVYPILKSGRVETTYYYNW